MTLTTQDQAKAIIKNAKNILIAPSSPDGDSVGSALALMSVLQKIGKNVTVVATNDVPEYLKFLPLTHQINKELSTGKDFVISLNTEGAEIDHLKYEVENGKINIIVTPKNGEFHGHDISFSKGTGDFDLIITVDTGDLVQLGALYEDNKPMFKNIPVLNIDHHASNGKFGVHNFLDYSVAATTQMLTPLILELEQEHGEELIDEDVATLLLVGIITDTGSFQHSNTTPEAFEVAADLLERGARQQEIIKHVYKTKSLATLKLWGRVLSKIQAEGPLVYSTISLMDLADTNASSDDSDGIIDELMSNAPNAEVVLLLKEKGKGFVTGSLRAPGKNADVSAIAQLLGGGGHIKAAGFRIKDKSLEEALEIVKNTVADYFKSSNQVKMEENKSIFPKLVSTPQTSAPKVSVGGEDLLLKDFRNKQSPAEEAIKEKSVRFFQDGDGQETVADLLAKLSKE